MNKHSKITTIVSACLAGVPCRYDGKSQPNQRVLDLIKKGEAVLVCPEQLAGFSTPRDPVEITKDKVIEKGGRDVTKQFHNGAKEAVKICKLYNCTKAILKDKSPSCGSCWIYDGSFSGRLVRGDGVFSKMLKKNGVIVESASTDS